MTAAGEVAERVTRGAGRLFLSLPITGPWRGVEGLPFRPSGLVRDACPARQRPRRLPCSVRRTRVVLPAVAKRGYSRILLRFIWRLVCTVINMAALVLLFGLGGALVALPPDQRDVVVNPETLGWSLLVEAGWFGLMFSYISSRE